MTQFQVSRMDDLALFPGIRLQGREEGDPVRPGTALTEPATGHRWEVLSVEFPTPLARQEGWTTILVGRTGSPPPAPGTVLHG